MMQLYAGDKEKTNKILVIERVVRRRYEQRENHDGTFDWYLLSEKIPFENEWFEDRKQDERQT